MAKRSSGIGSRGHPKPLPLQPEIGGLRRGWSSGPEGVGRRGARDPVTPGALRVRLRATRRVRDNPRKARSRSRHVRNSKPGTTIHRAGRDGPWDWDQCRRGRSSYVCREWSRSNPRRLLLRHRVRLLSDFLEVDLECLWTDLYYRAMQKRLKCRQGFSRSAVMSRPARTPSRCPFDPKCEGQKIQRTPAQGGSPTVLVLDRPTLVRTVTLLFAPLALGQQ